MDVSELNEQKERLVQLKKDQGEQAEQLENEMAENLVQSFNEFITASDKLIECLELFVEAKPSAFFNPFSSDSQGFLLKPEFKQLMEETSVSEKWSTVYAKLKIIGGYGYALPKDAERVKSEFKRKYGESIKF